MIHTDLIRSRAPGYPERGAFPHLVTRIIDDERRQQFTDEGSHFESEHFFALTYLPPVESEERLKGWMFDGHGKAGAGVARTVLDRFKSKIDLFENVFSSLFKVERLKRVEIEDDFGFNHSHDRLLRYLRRCVSSEDYPFFVPEIPAYLNEALATDDFCAGVEPCIGCKHIRVIAIDGFPQGEFPRHLG
jgi:type IV secretion system protein TrbE